MKIALVSPYDFAYPGGVVNHISSLEQNFTRMGHEVKIIAPASKAIHTFGDRFIPIGTPRPIPVSGSIARITISPWLAKRVTEVLEREQFDITHLHEPLVPMLCTTVLRLSRNPAVGTFHAAGGRPWYILFTPAGKYLLDKWFHRLDGRIAVSVPAMKYVSKYFPSEYTIIPNGVDCQFFCPEVTPIDEFDDDKLNILFVGRLEKRKGVDYLIEAFKQVKREIPKSRLIVVGPGTRLRHKYEKRIRKSELEGVFFTGYASFNDLPRYFKTADLVCCPATGRESFGIVLLEAMAVGKPIVATNIEGYASVLTDGAEGLLVPPRNPEKLAKALMSLLTDERMRREMGARGRKKAVQYDWTQVSRRLMDHYLKVLGKPALEPQEKELKAVPSQVSLK
jgi:phosphatidylinositol alpha-mannosyltransferase